MVAASSSPSGRLPAVCRQSPWCIKHSSRTQLAAMLPVPLPLDDSCPVQILQTCPIDARHCSPSIVGSYSSTKWLWMNWIVNADLPTPPPPTTTLCILDQKVVESRSRARQHCHDFLWVSAICPPLAYSQFIFPQKLSVHDWRLQILPAVVYSMILAVSVCVFLLGAVLPAEFFALQSRSVDVVFS